MSGSIVTWLLLTRWYAECHNRTSYRELLRTVHT